MIVNHSPQFMLIHSQKRLFVDTMRQMRTKAIELRKKDRAKIIQAHPWYKDMVDKIVLTGKREGPGEVESAMLEFIQG